MPTDVYVFAGGGTGGHLYPALAVADELIRLRPGARVVFACSDRDIDRRILSSAPHAFVPQPVRPLPRGARGWGAFLAAWVRSGRLARRLLRDLKPPAVLGLGGFAAAAVVRAAARAGIRTGLLSIDAVPGVANRHLARRVEAIFAQFASTADRYGRHRRKVRVAGCPVRPGLTGGDPAEARAFFDLRADRRTLLVVAGSLGAESVHRALAAVRGDLEALAGQWQVLHLTGPGKLAPVRRAWDGSPLHHAAVEYCDRMDLAYAAADLALCRAGASTIAELTATATPAVLVPYPFHRDRQQHHNAAALAASGSAAVAEDSADPAANAEALRRVLLPVLRQPERLAGMRAGAAGGAGRSPAAEIARWLAGAGG